MYSSIVLKQRYIILQSRSKIELLSITQSLGASLCSHRVIYIKGSPEEVPYVVYNPILFTLPKGPLGLPLMDTKIAHHDFPKDDMKSFQPINPKSIILYMKDTITPLRLQTHNITFSTYRTFLTSFNVSNITHFDMIRVNLAYIIKTSHIHISFIHVSSMMHKSTIKKTQHTFFYHVQNIIL